MTITHLKKYKKEIGVFSALWGFSEITIGSILHLMKIQFKGAILAGIAVMIIAIASDFIKGKGVFIILGLTAIAIKAAFFPMLSINPIIAMFVEALLAELIIGVVGNSKFSLIVFGFASLLYTFIHSVVSLGLFFGLDIYKIYYSMIESFALLIGLKESQTVWIIVFIALIHCAIGVFAALLGIKIAKKTKDKMKNEK